MVLPMIMDTCMGMGMITTITITGMTTTTPMSTTTATTSTMARAPLASMWRG